jgi:ribonuclease R
MKVNDNQPVRDRALELLARGGKPMAVRELARQLDLRGDARRELKAALRQLIADGEIVKIRGARVGIPARMNLVVGRLSCSPGGYGFVVPERPAPGTSPGARKGQKTGTRAANLYVAAANMKEALHGDRVVARVERETAKGPEGRIIRILERSLPRVVGRYEEESGRVGGYVVPFDRRILHELFIPPGSAGAARPGEMVSAEMTRPPTATRNPHGHVVEVLGRSDDPGVDLKVILAKYELAADFLPEVEAEAAQAPAVVRPEDLAGRKDFRDWPTVTIDPEDARDHDDAIGIVRHGAGWRLAVHIADVAHYVSPGGALDQEAYQRGTSVYFPDRVVPMLPHTLSSGICSLVEGQDRLTQTVLLDVDAQGRVVATTFHDGVIRSAARFSYSEVQKILDGDAGLRQRRAALVPLLEQAQACARLMRARRYARGSLDFDLPEPKLLLGPAGEMVGITAKERLESMRIVEEFMLAANEAVAAQLVGADVPTLYRIHEAPDPERVQEFCELVASLGYRVPTNVDEIRPEDLQRVVRQIEGKPEEKLVSYLLLRTMKLARYYEENLGHFGLATDRYLHFTSPIRRYPDLVVHRALRALRQGSAAAAAGVERKALPEMGRHLSERERRAAEAERELIEWKKVRFMAGKLGETFTGYVTGVQAFGLFVELEEIFVQGLVHVSSMTDDYYLFNERAHALKGENAQRVYRLGDRVEVQVARVDLERRQIDFALVEVLARPVTKPRGTRASRGAGRPAGASRAAGGRSRAPRRRGGRR